MTNTTLINKLQKALNKEYGAFGRIVVREGEHSQIEVIFEENEYLYEALNCYDITMYDTVSAFIDNILAPYGLYMELENSCIGTIWTV